MIKKDDIAWYAIIKLWQENDNILRQVSRRIEARDPVVDILVELYNGILKEKGIPWIALPQIGISKRWFVMNGVSKEWRAFWDVIINPEILDVWKQSSILPEWCLSEPWVKKNIARKRWIKVWYFNHNRTYIKKDMQGMEARVFLHEYDHLDGILLSDK